MLLITYALWKAETMAALLCYQFISAHYDLRSMDPSPELAHLRHTIILSHYHRHGLRVRREHTETYTCRRSTTGARALSRKSTAGMRGQAFGVGKAQTLQTQRLAVPAF